MYDTIGDVKVRHNTTSACSIRQLFSQPKFWPANPWLKERITAKVSAATDKDIQHTATMAQKCGTVYVWQCNQVTSIRYDTTPTPTPTPTHTHTHTFNGHFPGIPRWAGTRKVEPIWILLKQETMSGSGISQAICKSTSRSRQKITPASHHSVFTGRMPSCRPTNSVKAMKLNLQHGTKN